MTANPTLTPVQRTTQLLRVRGYRDPILGVEADDETYLTVVVSLKEGKSPERIRADATGRGTPNDHYAVRLQHLYTHEQGGFLLVVLAIANHRTPPQ